MQLGKKIRDLGTAEASPSTSSPSQAALQGLHQPGRERPHVPLPRHTPGSGARPRHPPWPTWSSRTTRPRTRAVSGPRIHSHGDNSRLEVLLRPADAQPRAADGRLASRRLRRERRHHAVATAKEMSGLPRGTGHPSPAARTSSSSKPATPCHYDGRAPHAIENTGSEQARVLIAIAPGSFEMPGRCSLGDARGQRTRSRVPSAPA